MALFSIHLDAAPNCIGCAGRGIGAQKIMLHRFQVTRRPHIQQSGNHRAGAVIPLVLQANAHVGFALPGFETAVRGYRFASSHALLQSHHSQLIIAARTPRMRNHHLVNDKQRRNQQKRKENHSF
jgi:hypothetical protein